MGTFVRKEAVRCYNGLLQVYRAPRGSVKLWRRVAAKSLGANGSIMASITIKNIPDGIYRRLRDSVGENHRSINSEVIACLEKVLQGARVLGVESGPLASSRTNLSFAPIARRAGLPISTVWRAPRNKDRQPQISTVTKIAAALDRNASLYQPAAKPSLRGSLPPSNIPRSRSISTPW